MLFTDLDNRHRFLSSDCPRFTVLQSYYLWYYSQYYILPSENKDILAEPISSVLGILFGYFLPFVIYKFHYSYTGKEGMGHGDFKLLAGLGAWLGWKMVPIILFFATITGLIYAFFLIVFKKIGKDSLIPFAPFLSLAGWILMFYGERIIDGYINSFI